MNPKTPEVPRVYEELAELFASNPTADRIMSFQFSRAAQARLFTLLSRQATGKRLTAAEKLEMGGYEFTELFKGLLRTKLRARVRQVPE